VGTTTKGQIAKDDLKLYDGANSTFTRKTSSGGTGTYDVIDWVGVDVLHQYGSAKNDVAITAAILAAGSSDTQFFLASGTWTITNSISIPENIALNVMPGVDFDGAGTLTFDNAQQVIARTDRQIFGSSITVVFTNGGTGYVEWWGENTTPGTTDMAAEIQAALTSGLDWIPLRPETYLVTSATISITGVCEISGYGESLTVVQTASTTASIFSIDTTASITIRDMRILNTKAGTPSAGAAIVVTDSSAENQGSRFKDLRIAYMYIGIDCKNANGFHIDRCEFVAMVAYSIRIDNQYEVDSGGWTIDGCNFDSDLNYTPIIHVLQLSAGGGRLSNSYFLRGQVGYSYFASTGDNTSMLNITGCCFELQDENVGGDPGWGIKIDPQGTAIFQRFAITGCILDQNYGIFIDGTADANINQGVITGNVFYGSGIDIDKGHSITITGNTFAYLATYNNDITYDGDTPTTIQCSGNVIDNDFTQSIPEIERFVQLANTTTPSIKGTNLGFFNNGDARALTNLPDYVQGQTIKLVVLGGTAPTIADGDPFFLSANWTPGLADTITLLCYNDDFIELSRGENS